MLGTNNPITVSVLIGKLIISNTQSGQTLSQLCGRNFTCCALATSGRIAAGDSRGGVYFFDLLGALPNGY